jgi:hypothetical protein
MYRKTLLMLVSLGLALAACGSDGQETGAGSDATTGDPDVTEPADTTEPADGDGPILGGGGAIGSIEVTVTHPDAEDLSYTIGCMGDTFPVTPEVEGVSGEEACQLLADEAVIDRLVNGAPADQVCTEIYGGPDVAEITGEIDGQTIDATITREDGCAIDDWDSLAGLLPPALGVTS